MQPLFHLRRNFPTDGHLVRPVTGRPWTANAGL